MAKASVATSFFSRRTPPDGSFSSSSSSSSARSAGLLFFGDLAQLDVLLFDQQLQQAALGEHSGLALTSSSLASSFSASRISCLRSSVASSFRSSASFWRTSAGISAAVPAPAGPVLPPCRSSYLPFPWAYLLSFVSGGRSRSGNKNAPLHAARKLLFLSAQNRAFLLLFCGKKRLKKTLCRSSQRKRRTQLLLLSDPPRRLHPFSIRISSFSLENRCVSANISVS